MESSTPPSQPVRQNEPAIDRDSIAKAALGLLDEVGLDGLTMRSLAQRLGIKAASLYWHLSSKQDLMGLLAEEICAPMQEPDRSRPWLNQLDEMAHEFRRVLLMHREAARVLTASGAPTGPNRLRLAELILRTLLEAGFSPKDAANAGLMMNNFVTMFVAEETQSPVYEMDEGVNEATLQGHESTEGFSPTDYPSLAALAPYLSGLSADERFEFGLQIVKTGLEERLRRTEP